MDVTRPARNPKAVGSYDLLEKLGEGGMGSVWKARHQGTGELVAIKLLPPDKAQSGVRLKRFEQEFLASLRLHTSTQTEMLPESRPRVLFDALAGDAGALIVIAGTVIFAWMNGLWRSRVLWGVLGFAVLVPLAAGAIGHCKPYYGWMRFVPLAVLLPRLRRGEETTRPHLEARRLAGDLTKAGENPLRP